MKENKLMMKNHLTAFCQLRKEVLDDIRQYLRDNGEIDATQVSNHYQACYFNHHGEPVTALIESIILDENKVEVTTDENYSIGEDDMTTEHIESVLNIMDDLNLIEEQPEVLCPKCQSNNVKMNVWMNPNTPDKTYNPVDDDNEYSGRVYCEDCKDIIALPISGEEKIRELFLNNDLDYVTFDMHFPTDKGYIISVSADSFEYASGETGSFDELDEDTLENLAYELELQIEADKEVFDKARGF